MTRLELIRQKVAWLYNSKNENRDEYADWLYDNHVLIVASNAKGLAEKYGANVEMAEVVALLHDIADCKMSRKDPSHEEESLKIARELMTEAGYTNEEIELAVDDAIRFHSCHGTERPQSKEGLILSTADSLAHLKTDFYVFATRSLMKGTTLEDFKGWVLKKIDRDLFSKISFEDEREDARPDYEVIKNLFSR